MRKEGRKVLWKLHALLEWEFFSAYSAPVKYPVLTYSYS